MGKNCRMCRVSWLNWFDNSTPMDTGSRQSNLRHSSWKGCTRWLLKPLHHRSTNQGGTGSGLLLLAGSKNFPGIAQWSQYFDNNFLLDTEFELSSLLGSTSSKRRMTGLKLLGHRNFPRSTASEWSYLDNKSQLHMDRIGYQHHNYNCLTV